MFPSTLQSPISAIEMRRRVARETIVDAEWQKEKPGPRVITQLHPRSYSSVIEAMDIFPGGDFVLITLADGAIDIRPVAVDTPSDNSKGPLGPCVLCANSPQVPNFTRSTLLPSSDQDGYILVEVHHAYQPSHMS